MFKQIQEETAFVNSLIKNGRDDGDPTPTKKGMTCNVSLIPELKQAILKAEQESIDACFIQKGAP